MKLNRLLLGLLTTGLAFALAGGSASAQQYERFGRNDRQSLNLDPAKINLIASARASAPTSQIKVSFTLTAQGEPTAIRVITGSNDEFSDAQSIAALSAARFAPKMVDGVAVSSEQTVILTSKFARAR